LSFLAQISHSAASDTTINQGDVTFGPETDRLLRLLRNTSREESISAFAREIKAGMSYRQFLTVLRDAAKHGAFMQTARSFLCVKASLDPHDIKYPAAVFEDAHSVNVEWRPYLLAASVHSLHGTRSEDTPALVKVREALS